jgi:hypothetical protein
VESSSLPEVRDHIPYTVTAKEEREELLPGGTFTKVWNFYVEGPHGEHFKVTMPDRELDPATVDAAIQDKLHLLGEVHSLGPQPHPTNLAPGSPPVTPPA